MDHQSSRKKKNLNEKLYIYMFQIFERIVSQSYQGNEIRGKEEEQLPTPRTITLFQERVIRSSGSIQYRE